MIFVMQRAAPGKSSLEQLTKELNAALPRGAGELPYAALSYEGSVRFGADLAVERFRLQNGLSILLLEDHSAPVVAYHTWFKVGSRNEKVGKTGIAHLFEHLMFNEMEGLEHGAFDRKLEELGAESNASTWLDWTHYNIAVPEQAFETVAELEGARMDKLVLREPQVDSEKEVVANERRYRVDDDVEGAVNELLWSTAYEVHPYHWPTIGWMQDIEGFTVEDCHAFYKTYYSPNNATLVVVGDITPARALAKIQKVYGHQSAQELPTGGIVAEPVQTAERVVRVDKPTPTAKVNFGYKSPGLSHPDHMLLSVLGEILFGGRSSRVVKRLIRERELASDVRVFVSPFLDPGLFEVFASGRSGVSGETLLDAIDEEIQRVRANGVTQEELDRARARIELGLLQGLATADGKASTVGFYDVVLGDPAAAFGRVEALEHVTIEQLHDVARRYLDRSQRTVVLARPQEGMAA
jgi:zinc protease